jgi:tetratricopeptide (TPR) repeat protein
MRALQQIYLETRYNYPGESQGVESMAVNDKRKYNQMDKTYINISSQLDEIDALIGRLDSKNKDLAAEILERLDRIALQIESENTVQTDQNSYLTQLEYISKRIYSHAAVILNAFGGEEQYRQKRRSRNIREDSWWWYLDQWLAARRKKRAVRFSIITAALVILLITLGSLYNRFLAPSPEQQAVFRHENLASAAVESGDFAAAIQELDQALLIEPDNFNLRVEKGVYFLKLGENDAAQVEFDLAKQINPDPYLFYWERTLNETQIGLLDQAKLDAEAMLKYKPDSAEAYLMIGQIYEIQGESFKALEAYQKASDLADAQDNVEVITTVRLRMAFLMQNGFLPTLQQ